MRLALMLIVFHFFNVNGALSTMTMLSAKTKVTTDNPNITDTTMWVPTNKSDTSNLTFVTTENVGNSFVPLALSTMATFSAENNVSSNNLNITDTTIWVPTNKSGTSNLTFVTTENVGNSFLPEALSTEVTFSTKNNISMDNLNITNSSVFAPSNKSVTIIPTTNVSAETGGSLFVTEAPSTMTTLFAKTKVTTDNPNITDTTKLTSTNVSATIHPAKVTVSPFVPVINVNDVETDDIDNDVTPEKITQPDKLEESNGFGAIPKVLAILFIICFILCNLVLCWWCIACRNRQQSSPATQPSQVIVPKRAEQQPLIHTPVVVPPASNEKSGDDEVQAIEFKHVGPIQLQTKQHSISLIHELDMEKTPSQSAADQLVIDSALNEVYEIGSDVELRMDGDQPLKQTEKHPPANGRDVAIRE